MRHLGAVLIALLSFAGLMTGITVVGEYAHDWVEYTLAIGGVVVLVMDTSRRMFSRLLP